MNFDDMKNMMNMAESMRGKAPLDLISARNPQIAKAMEMQKNMGNPADLLSKMGVPSNIGGGMDMASVIGMMGNMKNQNHREPSKIYYGLTPIASFASRDIIYELNRYLSEKGK